MVVDGIAQALPLAAQQCLLVDAEGSRHQIQILAVLVAVAFELTNLVSDAVDLRTL